MRGTQDENNTGDNHRGNRNIALFHNSKSSMVEGRNEKKMKYNWSRGTARQKIKLDVKSLLSVLGFVAFFILN